MYFQNIRRILVAVTVIELEEAPFPTEKAQDQ